MASTPIDILNDIAKAYNNSEIEKEKKQLMEEFGIDEDDFDDIKKLFDRLDSLGESIEQCSKQIDTYTEDIKKNEETIQEANDKINTLLSEKQSLEAARQNTTDVNEQKRLDEQIKSKDTEINSNRDKVRSLNEENDSKRNVIKRREQSRTKLQNSKDDLTAELRSDGRFGDIDETSKKFRSHSKSKKTSALQKMAKKGGVVGKIAKTGLGVEKFMKGPWGVAIGLLVKAISFGIDKAKEYMSTSYENTMRTMRTSTEVNVNKMKSAMASWDDAVEGVYAAQENAANSQISMYDSIKQTELANMKLAHSWTNWIPIWGNINSYQEEALQKETELNKLRMENAQKEISSTVEIVKRTDAYLKKQDSAIHNMQREIGLTEQQTDAFEKRMLREGISFAKLGKTIQDALKIQTQLNEGTGRNRNLTEEDYMKSFAVGSLVGEDNLVQFQSQMDIFNHSISESADIMYDMYNDVNKMGLSQKKVTKDVLANLKLANKYDFKNGTKGFIEMAKWAENVRFNMSNLGSMLEKVQSGGLEGVITQAAKTQVLGGNFAMYSDPLAMMYESYNNPEDYAKRLKNMLGGLGRLDKETGETEFNQSDTMRIRAFAEANGMSVEDAKNMIREDNKKSVIMDKLSGTTLSEEQKNTIANTAQRDKDGNWVVKTLNGETKNIQDIGSDFDMGSIVSNNNEEAAIQYAEKTLSVEQDVQKNVAEINSRLGKMDFSDWRKMAEKSIEETFNAYTKNLEGIHNATSKYREYASEKQKEQLEVLSSISERTTKAIKELSETEKNIKELFKKEEEKVNKVEATREEAKNKERQLQETYKKNENVSAFKAEPEIVKARTEALSAAGDEAYAKGDRLNGLGYKWGAYSQIGQTYGMFHDGIATSNGNGNMMIKSSNVIPVNDGLSTIAKADKNDTALFAKDGGPFDVLFNEIFKKIDSVYRILSAPENNNKSILRASNEIKNIVGGINHFTNENVSNRQKTTFNGINTNNNLVTTYDNRNIDSNIIKNSLFSNIRNRINSTRGSSISNIYRHLGDIYKNTNNNASTRNTNGIVSVQPVGENIETVRENSYVNNVQNGMGRLQQQSSVLSGQMLSMKPIDVNINGTLNLNAGGNDINILDMIKKDPLFIRQLSQMIANEVGSAINGGRTTPFNGGRIGMM